MIKQILAVVALYASSAFGAITPAAIFQRLDGKEISDLVDSKEWKIEQKGKVVKVSPVPGDDNEKRHYQIEKYTAKKDGAAFLIFETFRDEDDGGNTRGWVQTLDGQLVAKVSDSFFEAIEEQDESLSHALKNTPRAIAPALDLNKEAARNAFLTKLVEEFEKRKVGDELDVDFVKGEQVCKIALDGKSVTCEISYLQDRFNGTLKAVLALDKHGKAVRLEKALFDGNF
jgi:hypothetical protein